MKRLSLPVLQERDFRTAAALEGATVEIECITAPVPSASSTSTISTCLLSLAMSAAACGAALAEVIRWNDSGEEVVASVDAAVLRYDGQGRLIAPALIKAGDAAGAGQGGGISVRAKGADPGAALPAIRLVATRYQDDPILARLGLTPKQWAAFFQAMIKVESNYTQGAVSHAGALGLAQLMPGRRTISVSILPTPSKTSTAARAIFSNRWQASAA
jgi:hypothetical protein